MMTLAELSRMDPIAGLLGEWAVTLNPFSVLLRAFVIVLLASIIGFGVKNRIPGLKG